MIFVRGNAVGRLSGLFILLTVTVIIHRRQSSYMPDLEFYTGDISGTVFCFAGIRSKGLSCVERSNQSYGSC